MPTAEECRQYAQECLRWADDARTNKKRDACLEGARSWTQAAARLSGEVNATKLPPSAPGPRIRPPRAR